MSETQESLTGSSVGTGSSVEAAAFDPGLRRYMLAVYNKVALGLMIAGALAYAASSLPLLRNLLFKAAPAGVAPGMQLTFAGCLVAVAPIVVLLTAARTLRQPTPRSAALVYWTVVCLFGASMGVMVLNFTGLSIATTFALAATAFAGLSLYGYTTRRDLTAFGSFLAVGIVGLLGGLVLNLALRSPAIDFVANGVGVLAFAGLIAYDTQRLKAAYYALGGDRTARGVASSYGALSLFIHFLNLFQLLLMALSGERR
jgi:FtsH-binding integral membrane protein